MIGYTNSGKSSLLNRLTGAQVLSKNQVFATLDPTTRKIFLPEGPPAVVTDTVGFIRKLPHQLVSAFRATLEEVVEADLILHVIDASDPDRADKRRVVLEVLEEIGAGDHPRLTVYNKSDLIDPGDALPSLQSNEFCVSAVTGDGLIELVAEIVREVGGQ